MAITTVELRNLLKTNFELFDFDYTFDDENFKKEIEKSIIDYYYFAEIGAPTPDAFKHRFRSRFQKVIGYYNTLHNTTLLEYNPLINYKMTEALDRLSTTEGNSNVLQDTTSNSSDNQTSVTDSTTNTQEESNSTTNTDSERTTNVAENEVSNQTTDDYPQNTISGDYRSDEQDRESERDRTETTTGSQTSDTLGNTTIEGTSHTTATMENIGENTSNQTTVGKTDGQQVETYEKAIEGLTGRTYQELIQLERENIIRIKSMIIQELKPCFMLTY